MAAEEGIEAGFVDDLLALQPREQAGFLRDAGMLNARGLDRLLDVADALLRDDPGRAQRLAEACSGAADGANAPAAVPRAAYIRVQAHDANGEFWEALRLTGVAYARYVDLGMNLEALRTNAGRMAVLLDLGRYQEALDAGREVLDALGGVGELRVKPTERQADLLAAPVHQNYGVAYEHTGRYQEALRAYAKAEQCYRNLGKVEKIGEIADNRGSILSFLGRGNEALASHEHAAEVFREAGLSLSYAMSLSNIGETHLSLGNYTKSLGALERSRRLLGSLEAHAVEYFVLRNTADAYLALNLYPEALASYQEVDGLLRRAGMEHDHARALWGMGSALVARAELERAQNALAEAARLFSAAENVPMLCGVMLEQAALLEARGYRTDALEKARRALDLVSAKGSPVQEVYARLRLADLALPRVGEAERQLLAARRLADDLSLPQLRYRLNERLGHLRRLQGRAQEARTLLERAVDEIEDLRSVVAQDAMRASFLRDKTAAYEDLLLLHLARDDEEGVRLAFAVAEQAKSRALVDMLTGVTEKGPRAADPELGNEIRTLQTDLNGVYSELLGDRTGEERPLPVATLRARADELERRISRLRLQSAARDRVADPFAGPVRPDDVRERVPRDTMLVSYHAAGDEVLAFVHWRGRVRVRRRLGALENVERLLHKLDVQWERFRAGRRFAGRHMAVLERSARQVLAAIYEELVAQLGPDLEEAASGAVGPGSVPKLSVVPHGALHRVPFHALFDGSRYLIERFEVSYAPSATVYALCQEREAPDRGRAAVFGVEDPLIPAATAEARTVAERLSDVALCVGDGATVKSLEKEAPNSRLLHLACHGLYRSDNPMFSALKLEDGWLTAADAAGLDLPGALVTLSACESGRAEVIGGDEVLGLTRAFLGAGAATLVVSLWLVQDETTAELMGNWYGRLRAGDGRASALRAAQLDLKGRHPHPYYWAPFVLIGKR